MTIKYTFSGHDSFQCKDLWLKKGYDFVVEKKVFTESSSVVYLGVGRNMVSSIRYWLRSFGIINDEGESTEFANAVLSSDQEAMQKAVKRFTTRCIVAVAIFFLPMLVNLIFSFPGMDAVRGVIFCDV